MQTSFLIVRNVTDVTLHCAISHQVTKSIKKLEERRSTLLFYHSKLQHVKTLASWQTPLKNLSMCCSVYNKDYWNFFELFIHVTSVRDLRFESSRTYILFSLNMPFHYLAIFLFKIGRFKITANYITSGKWLFACHRLRIRKSNKKNSFPFPNIHH